MIAVSDRGIYRRIHYIPGYTLATHLMTLPPLRQHKKLTEDVNQFILYALLMYALLKEITSNFVKEIFVRNFKC